MSYQLKCPDLVKTVPEICSLDVKLQGKSEKFLCILKIVDGFIVSEMQKITKYVVSIHLLLQCLQIMVWKLPFLW